ncbi:MAG: hypothetical protein II841_07215 [Bacteroidales bacterium]|nr:hypothetical protein [Bacteroidales bacterium]
MNIFHRLRTVIMALPAAMAFFGCQKVEEALVEEKKPVVVTEREWRLTVQAVKGETPGTKGLAIEGDESTTTVLQSIWKADEPVKVFLGTSCIGTLTAVPDPEDAHKATLSGTVTTSGLVAGTTTLTLLTPRESWDYIGQVGKLLLKDDAENSIEKKYHYTRATVLVTEVSGGSVRTKSAFFANEQSIYRLSFLFQAGGAGDKTPVLAKSVIISSENGHLVQSQSADGSSLEEGPVTVTLGTASSEPFFVALRNGDETNEEALGFTVIDDDGVTYKGSKTIPAQYKPNGTFLNVKNATLTGRLGLDRSAAEVREVL